MQQLLEDHSWPYLPACPSQVLGIAGGPTEWPWPYCDIFHFLWMGSFNTYWLAEIFFIHRSQTHLRIDSVLSVKLSRIFHRFYQVFWAGRITPEGFWEWDREGKSPFFCLTIGSFHISRCHHFQQQLQKSMLVKRCDSCLLVWKIVLILSTRLNNYLGI